MLSSTEALLYKPFKSRTCLKSRSIRVKGFHRSYKAKAYEEKCIVKSHEKGLFRTAQRKIEYEYSQIFL